MWQLFSVLFAILEITASEKVSVGIVHYNDIYGQLFPFQKNSNPPVTCAENEPNCVGGIAELAGHIIDIRKNFSAQRLNSEFVIATGNLISGDNGWMPLLNEDTYSPNKPNTWEKYGKLLQKPQFASDSFYNNYCPNYTTIGVREFDGGIALLNTYLGKGERATRPLLSNLNCENAKLVEEIQFCSLVDSFKIVNVTEDYNIAIVGFVDPKVVHLSNPGTLELYDLIPSLKLVVEDYLSNVNAVIAIGTGSLDLVKSIADQIDKVKLVIYGNENDMESQTAYPLEHNGKYIAKAGMYGATIGKLVIDIETTTGTFYLNPLEISSLVEVDGSVEKDTYFRSELQSYRRTINEAKKLSTIKLSIDGTKEHCWTGECTLGDLVADSMVNCAYKDESLNTISNLIAVWHSGGLGNLELPRGNITVIDGNKLLPYSSVATLVTLTGATLKKMFIQSATALDDSPKFQWGQLLQVSNGLEVHYKVENGVASLSSLKAIRMDEENGKLKFETVEDAYIYNVVIPSDLYNGRNAYWDLPGSFISGGGYADHTLIGDAHTCVKNYLGKMGTMKLGLHQRIYIN